MSDQIAIDCERFDRENPEVYRLWKKFTYEMIQAGCKHGSAAMVAERIRWETGIVTRGEPVKLNNNYRALYARKYAADYPRYRDFFRTRVRRADTLNSISLADMEDLI